MIYLIGTNHELQHTRTPWRANPNDVEIARKGFKKYLEKQTKKLKPNLIAEELSEELLNLMRSQSNAKEIADTLGIEHRFCDPGSAARRELGLPELGDIPSPLAETAKHHEIRERYWLARLSNRLGSVIIFVCGAEHISSFDALLKAQNCKTQVLEQYWGSEVYDRP